MNIETIDVVLNLLESVDRNLARIADALDRAHPFRVDQCYPGTDADVTLHYPRVVIREEGGTACGDTPNSQD